MRSVRKYNRDWLVNSKTKGSGGAQAKLLEELKPEPWVYIQVQHNKYKLHGGMSIDDLAEFASVNLHTFEIIPTDRKREFYVELLMVG